jgi:hypothetical protein
LQPCASKLAFTLLQLDITPMLILASLLQISSSKPVTVEQSQQGLQLAMAKQTIRPKGRTFFKDDLMTREFRLYKATNMFYNNFEIIHRDSVDRVA